jgi:phosphatidylserine/phosphatidylglycerophosphate/cardiolipin synthase-like enzyme
VALATITPTIGPSPLVVSFDATALYYLEGGSLPSDWDLGRGTRASVPVPAHAYADSAMCAVTPRLPQRNNMKLIALAARAYHGNLLRGGVRIFEYEPGMLHAKTLVVDGHVAVVGSANVDIRSFRFNFEIGALMVDTRFAGDLERRFARDAAHAQEIKLDVLARMRWHLRVRCAVAKLLTPIL